MNKYEFFIAGRARNKENILKNQTENSIIGASKEEYEYYINLIKKKFLRLTVSIKRMKKDLLPTINQYCPIL